jgi:hypothetical protein
MAIVTILTSTVVAALVSGLINGLYNLRTKQHEYVNEYYKIIINRRVTAYETLEGLIVALKASVLDGDGRPYHYCFHKIMPAILPMTYCLRSCHKPCG